MQSEKDFFIFYFDMHNLRYNCFSLYYVSWIVSRLCILELRKKNWNFRMYMEVHKEIPLLFYLIY